MKMLFVVAQVGRGEEEKGRKKKRGERRNGDRTRGLVVRLWWCNANLQSSNQTKDYRRRHIRVRCTDRLARQRMAMAFFCGFL